MFYFLVTETENTREPFRVELVPLVVYLHSILFYWPSTLVWLNYLLLLQDMISVDHFYPSILILVCYLILEKIAGAKIVNTLEPFRVELVPLVVYLHSILFYWPSTLVWLNYLLLLQDMISVD